MTKFVIKDLKDLKKLSLLKEVVEDIPPQQVNLSDREIRNILLRMKQEFDAPKNPKFLARKDAINSAVKSILDNPDLDKYFRQETPAPNIYYKQIAGSLSKQVDLIYDLVVDIAKSISPKVVSKGEQFEGFSDENLLDEVEDLIISPWVDDLFDNKMQRWAYHRGDISHYFDIMINHLYTKYNLS